ncbi:MAG: ATP-binding cassette domain-containing protein [Synergistaceae bacterium]|nr:ATP-binding cassette domain-containing protein [Synergistaceae bacterium]
MNWLVTDGTRAGLVGDNGEGKTTLLRILAGKAEPDEGTVEYVGGATIGYLPQDMAELGDGSVMEFLSADSGVAGMKRRLEETEERISRAAEGSAELKSALAAHEELEHEFSHRGGYGFEAMAKKILRGLGFAPGDSERPCGEFSGGWRMRIALGAILLRAPDVLLLDEPTNHLDTESMEWLENWLRDYRGIILFVSHDMRFLERIASEIAHLERGEITRYSMGYERYLAEREAARERLSQAIEDQKEQIEHIQRFVERFRYKSSKATQVQSRIKQLEKMEIYEQNAPSQSVKIKFPEAPRSGYEVVSAAGISKRYADKEVFSDVTFALRRGERAALVGVNGAGKSTLMRLLSGAETPDAGTVKLGHNVKLAYFSQESAMNLDYSHTVWEEATRAGSSMTEAARRSLLGAFLFSGDDVKKTVKVLSGGEKSRLSLFKLILSSSNFLVLDEPTNHLDMKTREIFQNALMRYGGTLLIVSHDRYFLDNLAERVLEIRDGGLYDYSGNYSWFIAKRDAMLSGDPEKDAKTEPADIKEKRRREAEDRNRISRERKKFLDKLASIERSIESSEARRGEIDAKLCDPATLADSPAVQSLMRERKTIENALASDYAKWEELSEAASK